MVAKTFLNHFIHFSLELKKLPREFEWIFQECFICADDVTTCFYIGTHSLENTYQGFIASRQNFVHQFEFFPLIILEHVSTSALWLTDYRFSNFGDNLPDNDLKHLWFGLGHQPEVCIFFLTGQYLLNFLKVLWTIIIFEQNICFLLKELSCFFQEVLFEVFFIEFLQISCPLPNESFARLHWFWIV